MISFIDVSSILADLCCEQKEMIVLYEREEALFAESDSVRILLSESSPSVIGLPSPPQVQKPSVPSPPSIPPPIEASPPRQYRPLKPSWKSCGTRVNRQH